MDGWHDNDMLTWLFFWGNVTSCFLGVLLSARCETCYNCQGSWICVSFTQEGDTFPPIRTSWGNQQLEQFRRCRAGQYHEQHIPLQGSDGVEKYKTSCTKNSLVKEDTLERKSWLEWELSQQQFVALVLASSDIVSCNRAFLDLYIILHFRWIVVLPAMLPGIGIASRWNLALRRWFGRWRRIQAKLLANRTRLSTEWLAGS